MCRQHGAASDPATRGRKRSHGAVREIRTRTARPRPHSLEGRTRQARVRKCLQRRLENVDRALENDHERVPPQSPRPQLAESYGRADGSVLLRRRRQTSGRLRPATLQGLEDLTEGRLFHFLFSLFTESCPSPGVPLQAAVKIENAISRAPRAT